MSVIGALRGADEEFDKAWQAASNTKEPISEAVRLMSEAVTSVVDESLGTAGWPTRLQDAYGKAQLAVEKLKEVQTLCTEAQSDIEFYIREIQN